MLKPQNPDPCHLSPNPPRIVVENFDRRMPDARSNEINKPMKTPLRFLFTLLCAAIVSLPSVHAATITVTNTADSGVGSLRQALADASDGDTINFAVPTPATITLSSGELLVAAGVTISGPGANLLTVDANHASRVFLISANQPVTISGLTIANGSNGGDTGAGILSGPTDLTVSNCTLSGNSAGDSEGGGIYALGPTVISNSTFTGNSAGQGGGI